MGPVGQRGQLLPIPGGGAARAADSGHHSGHHDDPAVPLRACGEGFLARLLATPGSPAARCAASVAVETAGLCEEPGADFTDLVRTPSPHINWGCLTALGSAGART